MKFLVLGAVVLMSPMAASATTVADCTISAGCTCVDSPLSPSDLEVLFDVPPPPDAATQVFVVQDGKGIWSKLSISDIDITAGGDGNCAGPLRPEDGVWTASSVITNMVCGSGTAMMRSMMEANLRKEKPARVVWGGTFDGKIWETAWLAANPDPEATPLAWQQVSEVETKGSVKMAGMTSDYRMILLTPKSFRAEWSFRARNEEGPCNWDVVNMVRKTAD